MVGTARKLRFLGLALAFWSRLAGFSIEEAFESIRLSHPQAGRALVRKPADLLARENILYRVVGDSRLEMDVYSRKHDTGRPAVVIVHGGGWDRGSRQMERPLAWEMAARGYVAATVSYRLGEEGRFPAALHDIKAAVRFLRQDAEAFGIDSRNIAIIGASAGGQLALLVGATNGDLAYDEPNPVSARSNEVQAVVDIDGLADFTDEALVAQQVQKPSAPTRFLGGPFSERAEVWRAASPRFQITCRSAPVLFLNSTASSPLLSGREATAEELRSRGIKVETVTFPGTPHVFWLFEPWFSRVSGEVDEFLRSTRR